jgi:hypothetical protein
LYLQNGKLYFEDDNPIDTDEVVEEKELGPMKAETDEDLKNLLELQEKYKDEK